MTQSQAYDPILIGRASNPKELYAAIKPVRYRYVLAYLHETIDPDGTVHQAGEVMANLAMTQVSYSVGMYSGKDMTGTVFLPGMTLDLMPHSPLYDFARVPHPDQQGLPVGSMFEVGNRAVYVMRNDEVVWGGILWSRNYSSGTPTMSITALSWEGYLYYRLLRRSVVFLSETNVYTIWYALLKQALTDFTWKGVWDATKKVYRDGGVYNEGVRQISTTKPVYVSWTGLTKYTPSKHFNAEAKNYEEVWPYNSPDIELPPQNLLWTRNTGSAPTDKIDVKATVNETFRGYDMKKVGEALQEWADTETIASGSTLDKSTKSRFEYRVVCWFDDAQQRFRQRYEFGTMHKDGEHISTPPTQIYSGKLGRNTYNDANSPDNKLIFDYPGHISEWSLAESMEDAATRVIVTDNETGAAKHADYKMQTDLLKVPAVVTGGINIGAAGWRLYDHLHAYNGVSGETKALTALSERATTILENRHVPQAAQISDLGTAPTPGKRTSYRSTDLSITLYQEPTTPMPTWELGDWATFAIEDPFYGGKMYLQRRIIGYTVTVVPDHESDYSHEQITLELTDETRIAES